MFGINTDYFANKNLYLNESVIEFDQVMEKDRLLIEKNLKKLFPVQMSKVEISPLSGGKSGDSLYVGRFETKKFVIRIMPEARSKACVKQLAYSQMAAQKQIGPSVLYQNLEDGIFITEFIEGMPLLPNVLDDEGILLQLSRGLHDIHHAENSLQDEYNVLDHTELNLQQFIQREVDLLKVLEKCLTGIRDINSAIRKRNLIPKPCHNDIHMTNVFYNKNQCIKFIDWGDAGLGDPFFDLACASIEFQLSKDQTEKFLYEYFSGNISLIDRSHFFLMQHLSLLKIGLYFIDLPHFDETTKCLVISYFKKNQIEADVNNINSPKDVAEIILNLLEQRMSSEEFKQALLTLEQF